MARESDLLSEIRVASPCTASWDEMRGDDRTRFCEHCRLNVYNLSEMSHREAEALVREKEGRLCVRFYARRDGTMLTRDCPVGFQAVRRWLLQRVGVIGSAYAAMSGLALLLTGAGRQVMGETWLAETRLFRALFGWLDERAEPPRVMMGTVPPMPAQPQPIWEENWTYIPSSGSRLPGERGRMKN
jgi:hypothetical protein